MLQGRRKRLSAIVRRGDDEVVLKEELGNVVALEIFVKGIEAGVGE
jgi:hypothetical protein